MLILLIYVEINNVHKTFLYIKSSRNMSPHRGRYGLQSIKDGSMSFSLSHYFSNQISEPGHQDQSSSQKQGVPLSRLPDVSQSEESELLGREVLVVGAVEGCCEVFYYVCADTVHCV